MIPTQSIPQDQWFNYFESMNRVYQGWAATVEVAGRDLGNQPVATPRVLQGFTFENRGSEAGDIYIEIGDQPGEFIIHHVDHPRTLRVAETQLGQQAAVQIESNDGTTTLVCLRRPTALPAPRV